MTKKQQQKKKKKTAHGQPEQDNFFARLESENAPPAQETKPSRLDSEIVIAFVAAVGVNLEPAEDATERRLNDLGYKVERIRVTKHVLPALDDRAQAEFENDYDRINTMMDVGTEARKNHGNEIVALGIAAEIAKRRKINSNIPRTAYLVHSLKHPQEVRKLREIYPRGFYLIGLHSPGETRVKHLCGRPGITLTLADKLILRDRKESDDWGQQLIDTFHLADFFSGWRYGDDPEQNKRWNELLAKSIYRFIDVVFGHPNKTPTFGEYSMFLAFSAALRSADLSNSSQESTGTGCSLGNRLREPTHTHGSAVISCKRTGGCRCVRGKAERRES
jgi:hypothetical protein